jgi:hypothetical protein
VHIDNHGPIFPSATVTTVSLLRNLLLGTGTEVTSKTYTAYAGSSYMAMFNSEKQQGQSTKSAYKLVLPPI